VQKVPSEHHFVDQSGYKLTTRASRCGLTSRATVVNTSDQSTRVRLPSGSRQRKRSLLLIQHLTSDQTLYVSGDGVNVSQGYPLATGVRLTLPASPLVRAFSVKSGLSNVDVRTLEVG